MKIDPANASPEQLMKYQEAQGQLGMAIGRLLSISENYPNLKTNTSFQELRNQWEQTENRINTARVRYNEAVGIYNTTIKTFPNNMLAGTFGFTEKSYFKSDPGASKAPKAKFD
jgi:LemA protein